MSVVLVASCGDDKTDATSPDAPTNNGSGDASSPTDAPAQTSGLGTVTDVMNVQCPGGLPSTSTCRMIAVTGCPGFETEKLTATVALVPTQATLRGTIAHFKGGGGEGWELNGLQEYADAGFQQALVSWTDDWEQTQSLGIKAGGCRPSTVLKWIFDDPMSHNGSRSLAFCGQGFSGGSAQLGYALSHYGLDEYLDYVNELSGPPFARIDLGCDHSQPATATVCGAQDTMYYGQNDRQNDWENTTTCGSSTPLAADLAKWHDDSILVGGKYNFPNTEVQFFDCTNNATIVTAMAQLYYNEVKAAGTPLTDYHCYSAADGCMGESLGSGARDAVDAMIEGCVPHHQ
jgi:hypothetical protein